MTTTNDQQPATVVKGLRSFPVLDALAVRTRTERFLLTWYRLRLRGILELEAVTNSLDMPEKHIADGESLGFWEVSIAKSGIGKGKKFLSVTSYTKVITVLIDRFKLDRESFLQRLGDRVYDFTEDDLSDDELQVTGNELKTWKEKTAERIWKAFPKSQGHLASILRVNRSTISRLLKNTPHIKTAKSVYTSRRYCFNPAVKGQFSAVRAFRRACAAAHFKGLMRNPDDKGVNRWFVIGAVTYTKGGYKRKRLIDVRDPSILRKLSASGKYKLQVVTPSINAPISSGTYVQDSKLVQALWSRQGRIVMGGSGCTYTTGYKGVIDSQLREMSRKLQNNVLPIDLDVPYHLSFKSSYRNRMRSARLNRKRTRSIIPQGQVMKINGSDYVVQNIAQEFRHKVTGQTVQPALLGWMEATGAAKRNLDMFGYVLTP